MWEWALDAPSPSAEAQGIHSATCIQTHCVLSRATKANSFEEKMGKNQLPSRVIFFLVGIGSSPQMGECILQWALDQIQCLVSPEMQR